MADKLQFRTSITSIVKCRRFVEEYLYKRQENIKNLWPKKLAESVELFAVKYAKIGLECLAFTPTPDGYQIIKKGDRPQEIVEYRILESGEKLLNASEIEILSQELVKILSSHPYEYEVSLQPSGTIEVSWAITSENGDTL